jgi:predicted alpha/beta-hydrolase family hydrolase
MNSKAKADGFIPDLKVYRSAHAPRAGLVLAHGAGAGHLSSFMVNTAAALAGRDMTVATFDFPYMAARKKVPDRGPVLEEAWRAAISAAAADASFAALPLFIGGKSMGGRIASQAAAAGGLPIAGLVFLGYPLHPPGKPAQRRDRHLPSISVPMLFVQGTRDAFGTAEEIRGLLPSLHAPATLHVVEDGDHSFKVPARTGRASDVLNGIYDAVARWIAALV